MKNLKETSEKSIKRDILKFIRKRQFTESENQNVESINCRLVSKMEDIENEYCESSLTDNEDDHRHIKTRVESKSKRKSVESIINHQGVVFHVDSPSTLGEFKNDNTTTINELKRTSSIASSSIQALEIKTKSPKAVSNSRLTKFHRYFPQINKKENIINYFTCALVRDILLQGQLYITSEHFAFHSNVFGYVTNLVIPTSSVRQISKEKTAKILPNAVAITTNKGRHVFVNFFSRDSALLLMSSVCPQLMSEKAVPQTTAQHEIEDLSFDDDSNCSLNGFETVHYKRSVSSNLTDNAKNISTMATTTPTKSVSVSPEKTPMASSTLTPTGILQNTTYPKVPAKARKGAIFLTEEHVIYLVVLLTLVLTFFSIFMLYRLIDIEAKASIYHTTTYLKSILEKVPEGASDETKLDNLQQIKKVQSSLETLSMLIQNKSVDFESENHKEMD